VHLHRVICRCTELSLCGAIRQKKVLLSVEFLFRQGPPSLNCSRTAGRLTYSALAHRQGLDIRVSSIIRTCVAERSKKDSLPEWVCRLLPSTSETSTVEKQPEEETVFILSEPPLRPREPRQYHFLDQSRTLGELLKGRSFVEFPTIEIMSRSDHEMVLSNVAGLSAALPIDIGADSASGGGSESEDETRNRRKRRKLDPDAGKQLLSGLMAYGSDTSGSDNEAARPPPTAGDGQGDKPSVFDALGEYESDDLQSAEEDSNEADESAGMATETARAHAGGGVDGSASQRRPVVMVDDEGVNDEVDWGGSDCDE
jgi:hypothetical protein